MKLHMTEKPTEECTSTVMSSRGLAVQVSDLWGLLNPKMISGAEVTG